jgi:hypothetical protein
MQEIRDYIYGMLKTKWSTYLYQRSAHKYKWVFNNAGPLDKLEQEVKRYKGKVEMKGEQFHIIGGVVQSRDELGDLDDSANLEKVPSIVYRRITMPTGVAKLGNERLVSHTLWGIYHDEPNWELIGVGLPTIVFLEELRRRGKFDKIRVCQYIPEYLSLESCEMRIWDREENRLV